MKRERTSPLTTHVVNENGPTFDQLLQLQITASKYTFHPQYIQPICDQYTNPPHYCQIKPTAKTAGSDHKIIKD